MLTSPQIYLSEVMHMRLFPKRNGFAYKVYYLALPLDKLEDPEFRFPLPINRFGLLSFFTRDHGDRNNRSLSEWIRPILTENGLDGVVKNIMLVTLPRVLGYVFNPVSFWFCLDEDNEARAVLCEVNNTFGETHSYLCSHPDRAPLKSDDSLRSDKLFHVSPFLKREGHYTFKFRHSADKLSIGIDFYDAEGKKQLITAMNGKMIPLNRKNLMKAFFRAPLVTFKTIWLIHWQALKIILKGIRYISKPIQFTTKFSKSSR